MFTQTQTAKYKQFNFEIQNPLSIISNDNMYPTSSHIFPLAFWGPEAMLSIASTKHLKEGVTAVVTGTEHKTWTNRKQKVSQVTFW